MAYFADQLHLFWLYKFCVSEEISLEHIMYVFLHFVKMQVGVFWNLLIYSIWKNEQQNIYIYQYWGLKKVLYHVQTYLERVNQWIVHSFVEFIINQWLILLALRPSFGEHAKFLAVCATFVIPTSDRCKQQGEAGSRTKKKTLQAWLLRYNRMEFLHAARSAFIILVLCKLRYHTECGSIICNYTSKSCALMWYPDTDHHFRTSSS